MKLKRLLSLILSMALLLTAAALAGGEEMSEARALELAEQVLVDMLDGDFETVISQLDESIAGALSADQLRAAWDGQTELLGGYVETTSSGTAVQGGYIAQLLLTHEWGTQVLTCGYNDSEKLIALTFSTISVDLPEESKPQLPEGASETPAVLLEGTDMELDGMIVLPEGDGPYPAVVLVHGSGASDMDETILGNQPFRDIAYGLAERGIASIRFDKMNYAHSELFDENATVELEYLISAQAALETISGIKSVGSVYVVGHSLGGMLTPYLIDECGFDGGIILAGSPRKLWEISMSQNLALLEDYGEADRDEVLAAIEEQAELAGQMNDMTEEELREITIFGMPGIYLESLEDIDAAALAKQAGAPLLIMQGEADFQVTVDEDFDAWQEAVGDLDGLATYRLYPGLNHLFMPSTGPNAGTAAEYNQPSSVSGEVIDDMASWILEMQ